MAKLARLPNKDIIDKLAGVLDFYYWRGIPCVRKWPAKKRGAITPQEKRTHPAFIYINRLAHTLPPNIVAQWTSMISGTNLTWKDLLVRAYIGHTYEPPERPKTLPWSESDDHFCILKYEVSISTYYIYLNIWTDIPVRLYLSRLNYRPVKQIVYRPMRGNPNFKDLWWHWEANAFESTLPPTDKTYHELKLNRSIPHYSRGFFFAATHNDLWTSSITQYFSPSDLLLT